LIPGIFIAGTGTDVGKTMVTAGVLRWLRRRGFAELPGLAELPKLTRSAAAAGSVDTGAAMAMKPVQTGCEVDREGRMRAPDIDFVLRAAGVAVDEETLSHLAPYRFAPACSPHLAARMAGQRIEMDAILASARWLAARYRQLVVEGAGGVMVPLNESQTMLDLAWEMRMPVLLVGHSGLGTINHVLLSLEAIRRRGCEVLGVILNDTQPVAEAERYIAEDNVRTIECLGKVGVVRTPYLRMHLREAPQPSAEEPLQMAALDAILAGCDFLRECPL
jgi:dethiobiotin synthetase